MTINYTLTIDAPEVASSAMPDHQTGAAFARAWGRLRVDEGELARILDEQLIPLFSAKFVAWNRVSAEIWAKIYVQGESSGRCPALIGSVIAATAHSHGMTIVTRNVSDFQFEGLKVINPIETPLVAG